MRIDVTVRLVLAAMALCLCSAGRADTWVRPTGGPGDFVLADRAVVASIVHAPEDATVVGIAARDLAADIERVTGHRPAVRDGLAGLHAPFVLVGTLGSSAPVDALVAAGKLDVRDLRGAWESFVITTVEQPLPGVDRALVIVGSDRRGTAFGVYELAQAIGVSPWYWWADVAPPKQTALYVAAGARRFGPPSVKYRGIFINDEDWGLQAWAKNTFEPASGGIGPKTYARVFELLLRLKANTLWPAMHPGTPAFNSLPANAPLADDYAIVMGSSHAEPMLRNNVSEWKAAPEAYDYLANPAGVLQYWDARVAANAQYENIYTIGMRGIHDGRMAGPKTDSARVTLLEKIFADQRAVLARRTAKPVAQVPQVFAAYKEVLGLYRQGLHVPDDVTLLWPDDNFGYIRGFPDAAERQRAGGNGVYYHLSYLGAPMSYLWLETTPPALIWEEMAKAYDAGMQRIWIVNVGDIKPGEIGTELFLQMAWDVHRWTRTTLPDYLTTWAAREFGAADAPDIAAIMQAYYRLNFVKKPEHLQGWLPKEAPRHSGMAASEAQARVDECASLRARVEQVGARLGAPAQDAYFELVAYPVVAAALANERFIEGERGNRPAALAADARLAQLLAHWNTGLAQGKWRHMMTQDLPETAWRSLRAEKWRMPAYPPAAPTEPEPAVIAATRFSAARAGAQAAWQIIPGLGKRDAVALFPTTAAGIAIDAAQAQAPRLDYPITATAGPLRLRVRLVPTHPLAGDVLRFALGVDGARPRLVALDVKDGGPEWAQGVLDASRTVTPRSTWHQAPTRCNCMASMPASSSTASTS